MFLPTSSMWWVSSPVVKTNPCSCQVAVGRGGVSVIPGPGVVLVAAGCEADVCVAASWVLVHATEDDR